MSSAKIKVSTILFSLIISFFMFSACNDSENEELKGRWQLLEIRTTNGNISKVDTVYYSFEKDVFQYLKLISPTQSFQSFGMYQIQNDRLTIKVYENTFDPWDCFGCFDWETLERTFIIKQQSSSRLTLEFDEQVYIFRKY